MHWIIALGLTIVSQAAEPDVDAKQFERLIQGAYADLRDVTLIAEGERNFVGGRGQDLVKRYHETYQSTYACRSDGAMWLDAYIRSREAGPSPDSFRRHTVAFLEDHAEKYDRIPDLKSSLFETQPASHSYFFSTGSFGRVLFLWYFLPIKDMANSGYSFRGWEDVDGHRCLVVQFGFLGKIEDKGKHVRRFWIDMGRGGHPLRYEFLGDGKVETRVDKIVLDRFDDAKGKKIWLPIRGEYRSFGVGSKVSSSPKFVETYAVVAGSVRLNQGLRDEMFSARWEGDTAGSDEMKNMRQLTLNIPKSAPEGAIDPEGVKKNLDLLLANADAQSKRLEASSSARETWGWTPILQTSFIGAGFILIIGIFIYKRKMD